jgi:hypothetical protein
MRKIQMANNDQDQYQVFNSAYSNLLREITPTLSGDQVSKALDVINHKLVPLHGREEMGSTDWSTREILGISKDKELVVYRFNQPRLQDYHAIPPEELEDEIRNSIGHYDKRKELRPSSLSETNHREYQRNQELLVELEDLIG